MDRKHVISMTFPVTKEAARSVAEQVLGHLQGKVDRCTDFTFRQDAWQDDSLPWSFTVKRSFMIAEASGHTEVSQNESGTTVTVNFDQINETMRLLGWTKATKDTLAAYSRFLGQPTNTTVTPSSE